VSGWTGHDCSVVSIASPFPGLGVSTVLYAETNPVCVGPIAENAQVTITCPQTNEIISNIQFASFGTPSGSCGSFALSSCSNASYDVPFVQSTCLNKNTCSFTASIETFGDPCFLTLKHFYAQVTCAVAPVTVCAGPVAESEQLKLQCPNTTQVITAINFASYGTPTGSCGAFAAQSSCDASNSLSYTQSLCLGANHCQFTVGNTAFGDPCYLTAKHLYAQVTCA